MQLAGTTYLTVPEALDMVRGLGLCIDERTFRRFIRKSGAYLEHRRQIVLTEADLARVLEAMRERPAACPSSSSAAARSGTSGVPSAATVTMKALELARNLTRKRTA